MRASIAFFIVSLSAPSAATAPPKYIANADGTTAAVIVEEEPLIHGPQVFPEDLESSLKKIPKNIHPVKLNVVAVDQTSADEVRAIVRRAFPENAPATSFVVGKLAKPGAKYAMDMVSAGRGTPTGFSAERTLNVSPRLYISGQAENGGTPAEAARKTLASLLKTLKWLGCQSYNTVQCKVFLKPISAAPDVRKEFEIAFGNDKVPPLVFVEWESTLPIEIELIASDRPNRNANPPAVEYLTPPGMTESPVYCRVARVNARNAIYVSSLYSEKKGTGAEEVESVFAQLQDTLKKSGSDLKHLAKATYYVSGDDASKQLNVLRPKFYDPKRPPAASKATVSGVGMKDRTLTMDMIAVKARE
ncbi:MAG: RidA family protein [Gemmataceae bacterium]|nr:RidA family protein [Planctomycetia bacterium]MBX3399943.1 RidA family protein [Gemmataceae bacterium]